MDEKKVLKPIDKMLTDPWKIYIQELFEASVNELDEIEKKFVYLMFCKKNKKILLIVQDLTSSPLEAR